ncbi:hypothetical protein EJ08DRAFT_657799 [Tothia fuscella]|uniref:Uncharacterized protein n=1 Tax=Tothia fuscella TaxID=1048955 RepID=A0A9P4NWK0_9PEZI|nr:hypothetical protein EJ08DRAFT_657799 [Tothia fuscella]
MPPIRTMPSAKPVKTERTHEENQERAYIAASRRSDRSLEARIESARRASDIHKKRTGRALRVTEQDVVNEEMYEEEEADLPVQYRRLQAYMAMAQTSNVFDGRLNSYLLSTMATRNMANQGFMNPNMSSYQNTPFFPYTPPQSVNGMPSPQSMQAPAPMFRNVPQSPSQQGMSQGQSVSSSSVASPVSAGTTEPSRRTSKTQPASPTSPLSPTSQSGGYSDTPASERNISNNPLHAGYMGSFSDYNQQPSNNYSNFESIGNMGNMFGGSNINLLSSTLPPEAQQMFGINAFDPASFNNPYLMNSNHGMMVPPNGIGYQYNPNLNPSKPRHNSQTSEGINQTLAQNAYPLMQSVSSSDQKSVSYANMDNTASPYSGNMAFDTGNMNYLDGVADGMQSSNNNTNNDFIDFFDSDGGQNLV